MSSIDESQSQVNIYLKEKRYFGKVVEGSQEPGFSAIYKNQVLPDGIEPIDSIHPELDTLQKLFANAFKKYSNSNCLGRRKFNNTKKNQFDDFYSFLSFQQVQERKINIGSGILHIVTNDSKFNSVKYLKEGKPEFVVSILSPNRLEWVLVDIATRNYSLPNTALYPTLGKDSSKFILELTESPIIFLAKDQILKILEIKSQGNLPDLNVIVSFDSLDKDNNEDKIFFETANSVGMILTDLDTVERIGVQHPLADDFNPPTPETIYTFSFTSGTTGNPKGVVLTHRIAVAAVSTASIALREPASANLNASSYFIKNEDDNGNQITALSSLPLAHIYERQISNYAISSGYALCMLSTTDPKFFFDDMKIAKPHYLCTVPRVWNKVEAAIKDIYRRKYGIASGSKISIDLEVDRLLIRNAIRRSLGFENVRYGVSGSAPIGTDTINFLKQNLSIGFNVAYGSTESFGGISFGDPFEGVSSNSSGPPGVTCEMRLREIPQMGYSPNDKPLGRGELMLRGPQIFKEYYKNPKATQEAFTEDGWFYTGDVASFDSTGRIFIIDRVKSFFKLSQGEYVTPEKIENIYLANSPLLTQIFVHGDSLQNYLVGIAGIQPEAIIKLLKENHGLSLHEKDVIDLLKDPKFKTIILRELNHHIAHCDLQGFEKIHNLHFDVEPFKIEDEVLTPTLKLKRPTAVKKFQNILQKLYEEGSLIRKNKL